MVFLFFIFFSCLVCPHFSDFLLMAAPVFYRSPTFGATYVRRDVVVGVCAFAAVQLGLAAVAYNDATWWADYYRARADENQMNRILVDKVESYGSLIVSKLPSTEDR